MNKWIENAKKSANELKSVQNLTVISMFGAVSIVLSSMTLVLSNYVQIGFSSIAQQAVYALFGPITGLIFGGAMDVLKWFIRPTGAFFPGYTFNAMVAGFIYGSFYYNHKLTVKRIFLAEFLVAVVVNMFLGTLWINMMYGKAIAAILPMRVIKNLIMTPVNTAVFYTLMKGLEKSGAIDLIRRGLHSQKKA